jgi:hypothetical protein
MNARTVSPDTVLVTYVPSRSCDFAPGMTKTHPLIRDCVIKGYAFII